MYLKSVANPAAADILRFAASSTGNVLVSFDVAPIHERPLQIRLDNQRIEQRCPDFFF